MRPGAGATGNSVSASNGEEVVAEPVATDTGEVGAIDMPKVEHEVPSASISELPKVEADDCVLQLRNNDSCWSIGGINASSALAAVSTTGAGSVLAVPAMATVGAGLLTGAMVCVALGMAAVACAGPHEVRASGDELLLAVAAACVGTGAAVPTDGATLDSVPKSGTVATIGAELDAAGKSGVDEPTAGAAEVATATFGAAL